MGQNTCKGTGPRVCELEPSSPILVLSIVIGIQRALTQSLVLSGA